MKVDPQQPHHVGVGRTASIHLCHGWRPWESYAFTVVTAVQACCGQHNLPITRPSGKVGLQSLCTHLFMVTNYSILRLLIIDVARVTSVYLVPAVGQRC